MRQRIPTVDTVAFNNVELGITEKKTFVWCIECYIIC